MKFKTILLFLIVLNNSLLMAKTKPIKNTPNMAWLDSLIAKGAFGANNITDIKSYFYKEKLVFLVNFDAGCCDQYSAVLKDENGKTICYPFGGISGKGDMQCADFQKDKSNELIVWVNENPNKKSERKEKSFKMERQ